MAIIDFFDRGWDMDGDAVAYVQDDASWTFDAVGTLSCRIAHRLLALGLDKGSKGAVWSGNDVTAWACTLGLWRANLAWIRVNPRNAPGDNRFLLDAFDCELIFFQQGFADIITQLRQALPKVKHWVCIDGDADDAPSLSDWCAAQTSFAHVMLACTYRDGTRPVNLAAAPMTHTAGLLSLPCTAQGGMVVVLSRPEPALLVGAIARHRVTEFFLPPTVIHPLLEAPGIEKADFSSVRYLLYGAAPMSVEKLKKGIAP